MAVAEDGENSRDVSTIFHAMQLISVICLSLNAELTVEIHVSLIFIGFFLIFVSGLSPDVFIYCTEDGEIVDETAKGGWLSKSWFF